jgi:hypothetical protein
VVIFLNFYFVFAAQETEHAVALCSEVVLENAPTARVDPSSTCLKFSDPSENI